MPQTSVVFIGPQAAPYKVLFYGGLALWAVPHAILDAGWERPAYFGPYPYAAPNAGPLLVDPPRMGTGYEAYVRPFVTQPYSVRASIDQGSDFRKLQRTGVRLFIDTDDRLGLRTHWDYYRERQATGPHDFTWFGDLSVLFRFVQNDTVLMHTGLGVKALLDRSQSEYGVNVLYGIDVFPLQPLHLSASVEGGTVGRAGFLRLRAEVGVNYQRVQAVVGYDFMRVGTVNLYGPYVGVRVWY